MPGEFHSDHPFDDVLILLPKPEFEVRFDDMDNPVNTRLLKQLPSGSIDRTGIVGLQLARDRLPNVTTLRSPTQQQHRHVRCSGVNNDLDFAYHLQKGTPHGWEAFYIGDYVSSRGGGRGPVIDVNEQVSIPEGEIEFRVSSSSGPGGQNVNRVRTRVTLLFDVVRSTSLSDADRQRILTRLKTRINKDGVLRVRSQKHRTQERNRTAAEQRLGELLRDALARPRVRRSTKTPTASKRRRVEEKRRRSRLKQSRSSPAEDE